MKSIQDAKSVFKDIVNHSNNIYYFEQYQVDDFLGQPYRKIIVGNFKIIYKIHSEVEIRILQIFDNRQNPNKIRK